MGFLQLIVEKLHREARIADCEVLREVSDDVVDEQSGQQGENVIDIKEEENSLTVSAKNEKIEIRLAAEKTELEKLGTDHTPPDAWSLPMAIEGPASSQSALANTGEKVKNITAWRRAHVHLLIQVAVEKGSHDINMTKRPMKESSKSNQETKGNE